MPCFPTLIFPFRSSKSDVLCLACDANELNPCLNPSANQCTKASSESCCVDRLYVINRRLVLKKTVFLRGRVR